MSSALTVCVCAVCCVLCAVCCLLSAVCCLLSAVHLTDVQEPRGVSSATCPPQVRPRRGLGIPRGAPGGEPAPISDRSLARADLALVSADPGGRAETG